MAVYPGVTAGIDACQSLVNKRIMIHQSEHTAPTDFMTMLNDGPRAYSIELVPLANCVNVSGVGRFGFGQQKVTSVPHPVPHTDPNFGVLLRTALAPVIERELERLDALAIADREKDPNGPIEARDAVRRIV